MILIIFNTTARFLLRWTAIGLFVRFLLMPFTLHAVDLFFIHYIPYVILQHSHANVYHWFNIEFPHSPLTAYPIGSVYLSVFFQALLKPFLLHFPQMMETFANIAFREGGSNVHLTTALQDPYFFRTLFLLKLPYLFFDFATVLFLFSFCSTQREKQWLYRFWMLNPVALHTSYGIGQIDGIIAFFLVVSSWCLWKNRLKWGMFFLGVGGLVKLAPFYLVPPLAVILKEKWRDRLFLIGAAVIPLVAVFLFSKNTHQTAQSLATWAILYWKVLHTATPFILLGAGYSILFWFFARSRKIKREALPLFFCSFLLLLWGTISLRPRHLLWALPFLAVEAVKNPFLWGWIFSLFVAIWELHAPGINYQLGIFSPVEPTFFSSLPILDSYLTLITDLKWIHRLCLIWSLFAVITILFLLLRRYRMEFQEQKLKHSFLSKEMLSKTGIAVAIAWIFLPMGSFIYATQAAKEKIPVPEERLVFKDIGEWKTPDHWTELDGDNGNKKISQVFLCNFDQLFRVGVYIKLSGDKKPGPLHLGVRSYPEGYLERSVILTAEQIRPNSHDFYNTPPEPSEKNWFRVFFDFEPIPASQGQRYQITLENASSDPSDKIWIGSISGNEYRGLKQAQYEEGNKRIFQRTLAFVTACRYAGNPSEIPQKLKQKLEGDPSFYHFYQLTLILVALGWGASFFTKRTS